MKMNRFQLNIKGEKMEVKDTWMKQDHAKSGQRQPERGSDDLHGSNSYQLKRGLTDNQTDMQSQTLKSGLYGFNLENTIKEEEKLDE